ncbi:MAG TPA: NADH pyrophosphatase, partial [Rhodobacteraceae bacterium]|nr:NADH pyrophosphatase [Paracoccaceae bacterium]
MRDAETVTFGGSGFDRAGQIRGDTGQFEALLSMAETRVLPVWRGKPLIASDT